MRIVTLSQISGAEEMFDGFTATQTSAENVLQKTFSVAGKNAVAILNTYGVSASLAIAGGETIEVSLIRDSVRDWWDYFFAPTRLGRDTVFYFPTQGAGVNATLEINYPGNFAKCGLAVTGVATQRMNTMQDIEVGICDYSKMVTDEYERIYLSVGNWAKRASARLSLINQQIDMAYRDVIKNRATPTVFDYNEYSFALGEYHSSTDGLQALIIYGFTQDFYVDINGPRWSEAHHESQGLV